MRTMLYTKVELFHHFIPYLLILGLSTEEGGGMQMADAVRSKPIALSLISAAAAAAGGGGGTRFRHRSLLV